MMSFNKEKDNQGALREAVDPILRVLSQLGGHFIFTDQQGEQFVITSKKEFDASQRTSVAPENETQLPLAPRSVSMYRVLEPESADQVLENINRDIALYQIKQQEETIVDEMLSELQKEESVSVPVDDYDKPLPPPVRVRFEPIRGDLPPDLQE